MEESEIEISELDLRLTLGSNHESRRAAFRVLVEALKGIPNQQRLDLLNAMEGKYGAGDQAASEKIRKVSKPLADIGIPSST